MSDRDVHIAGKRSHLIGIEGSTTFTDKSKKSRESSKGLIESHQALPVRQAHLNVSSTTGTSRKSKEPSKETVEGTRREPTSTADTSSTSGVKYCRYVKEEQGIVEGDGRTRTNKHCRYVKHIRVSGTAVTAK